MQLPSQGTRSDGVADQDAVERFTCLYERTRPRVYAFAVSHAGRQLAEEIVSEVYLIAWRKLADIPRPELPWLLSVARNVTPISSAPQSGSAPSRLSCRPGLTLAARSRSAARLSWTLPSASWTTRPASAGAAAAWRAEGSPPRPHHHGRQQAWWQSGAVGYLGNGNLTFAQFRALPSAPARLAAVVRRAARAQGRSGVRTEMFDIYDQLLKRDPITPQVRAAVFRDLAALPGVRSGGWVTDPLGRAGYGIEMPGKGTGAEGQVPASGARPGLTSCPHGNKPVRRNVCGTRVITRHGKKYLEMIALGPQLILPRGSLESYDAVVRVGWTSAKPRLPAPSQRFSTVADGRG
jgi:hypothetical protein